MKKIILAAAAASFIGATAFIPTSHQVKISSSQLQISDTIPQRTDTNNIPMDTSLNSPVNNQPMTPPTINPANSKNPTGTTPVLPPATTPMNPAVHNSTTNPSNTNPSNTPVNTPPANSK